MKAERFQSLCAFALLAGLLLTGLGGLGMYYSGTNSVGEKAQPSTPEKQPPSSPSPALQSSVAPRTPAQPSATPVTSISEHKATPALVTSGSSTATPAVALVAKIETTLTDKQRKQIVDSLRKHGGKITICSVESDAAGLVFATTLKRAFEDAGWQVDGVKQIAYTQPPAGLNLACGSYPTPEGLVAVYRAFAAAGLHVSQQLDTKLLGTQVELIVGTTLQN